MSLNEAFNLSQNAGKYANKRDLVVDGCYLGLDKRASIPPTIPNITSIRKRALEKRSCGEYEFSLVFTYVEI